MVDCVYCPSCGTQIVISSVKRKRDAINYRRQGLSLRAIARLLGVSHETIRKDVKGVDSIKRG